MSKRTDEELIKIVTVDKNDYQPLAVAAAEEEIKNRNLDVVKIKQIESDFETERNKNQNLNNKSVSSLIRFVNFIIDTIIWYIIAFIVMILLVIISGEFSKLMGYAILFVIFFCYYYIMEAIYQKTVAKFITKTKVVTKNEDKPNKVDIFARTFCRFIPFDQISFLFTRNGFHDRFSSTQVIKDNKTELLKNK